MTKLLQCLRDELVRRDYAATTIRSYIQIVDAFHQQTDGVGLPEGWTMTASRGTGLRNLASRLAAEFGDQAALAVSARHGGGVLASITLPFVRA